MKPSPWLIGTLAVLLSGIFLLALNLVLRSHRRPVTTGAEAVLAGEDSPLRLLIERLGAPVVLVASAIESNLRHAGFPGPLRDRGADHLGPEPRHRLRQESAAAADVQGMATRGGPKVGEQVRRNGP